MTFSKKCNAIAGGGGRSEGGTEWADQEGIAENVGGPTEADFIEGGGEETRYRRVFSLATDTIGNRFACKKIFSKEKNDQRERGWELWTTRSSAVFYSSFLYFSFPPPLFLSVSSFPSLPLLFFQSARFHATHDPRVFESRSMFRHQVFRIPFRFDTPLSGVWARLIVSYSISLHYGGYVRGITTGGIIFRSTFIYFVLWPPNVPFSYIYVYMLCVNYHDSRENVK